MELKNLNRLTWQKSKTIIVSLGMLLILFSMVVGFNSTNYWQKNQNYLKSGQARADYNSYLQKETKIESEINKKYHSQKDYQKALDYGYSKGSNSIIGFNSKTGKYEILMLSLNLRVIIV